MDEEYDYIIIGAGIGGLVLANRLSEDADSKVLVIEAGPNHIGDPFIDTPGLLSTLYGNPDYDWDYMSVPQVWSMTSPSRINADNARFMRTTAKLDNPAAAWLAAPLL